MKKITQQVILTTMMVGLLNGGCGQVDAATAKRDVLAYQAEPFIISVVYPHSDSISVHYYGIGDETKTNYLNVYWSNFSDISEAAMDEMMSGVGTEIPIYANQFVNKKVELSPNTKEGWRIWRYTNMGDTNLIGIPGVLYYSVRLANGDFLTGKADYRDCLNNPLYIEAGENAYCKMERYDEDGNLYYWPYSELTGERLGLDYEPVKPIIDDKDEEKDNEDVADEGCDDNPEEMDEEPMDKDDDETEKEEDSEDKSRDETEEEDFVSDAEPKSDSLDLPDKDKGGSYEQNDNKEKIGLGKNIVPKTPNTGFGPRK